MVTKEGGEKVCWQATVGFMAELNKIKGNFRKEFIYHLHSAL
jgi:hypothetical protein